MTNTATLRTVTVGEGTLFPFAAPPQLPGVTARQSVVPLITGGATFIGPDVGEAGTLPLEVLIDGASSQAVMPLLDQLVAAWAPSSVPVTEELTMVLADQVRIYRGRPSGAIPNLQWLVEGRLAAARLGFTVTDPRWYWQTPQAVSVTAAGATGGMDTPMDAPMVTTGAGSSGDAPVTNSGTAPAPWFAVLTGGTTGTTDPRLILNGDTVLLIGTIAAGSFAVVDSERGSVTVDGVPRPWVSVSSDWWEILPGQSTFSYRASAGDGTATLTWRDASF